MTYSTDEFLEHFGIPGMKWGRRKSASVKTSSDHKKIIEPHLKKKPEELTNKQLKAFNDRANMAQNFNRLAIPPKKSTLDKGHNEVKKLLLLAGTAGAVYKLYHSPEGKAARAFGETVLKRQRNKGMLALGPGS